MVQGVLPRPRPKLVLKWMALGVLDETVVIGTVSTRSKYVFFMSQYDSNMRLAGKHGCLPLRLYTTVGIRI